jgi:hypothetical protein
MWSQEGKDAFEGNEHTILWTKRALIIIVAFFGVGFWILLASILLFPLIHNGAYYEGRKDISGGTTYPDGWRSEPSPFSSAKINFSFKQRVLLAAVAVIPLLLSVIA